MRSTISRRFAVNDDDSGNTNTNACGKLFVNRKIVVLRTRDDENGDTITPVKPRRIRSRQLPATNKMYVDGIEG
jgi:hypothetical protein